MEQGAEDDGGAGGVRRGRRQTAGAALPLRGHGQRQPRRLQPPREGRARQRSPEGGELALLLLFYGSRCKDPGHESPRPFTEANKAVQTGTPSILHPEGGCHSNRLGIPGKFPV